MDVAKTALRLGAARFRVIFLETRESMPAHTWEVRVRPSPRGYALPAAANRLLRDQRRGRRVCQGAAHRVGARRSESAVLSEGRSSRCRRRRWFTSLSPRDYGPLARPRRRKPAWKAPSSGACRGVGLLDPGLLRRGLLTAQASGHPGHRAGYSRRGSLRALGKVERLRGPHWNRQRKVRFTGYADSARMRVRSQVEMREPASAARASARSARFYPEQTPSPKPRAAMRCRWTIDKAPKKPRTPNLRPDHEGVTEIGA